jgi:hypothetical protein
MTDARKRIPGSLVDFQVREWNGAFGLAARVGEMGRGLAARPKNGVERRIQKFIKGAPNGGAKSCRVWRRSLSRGSQSRQVLATGRMGVYIVVEKDNGIKGLNQAGRNAIIGSERKATLCENVSSV